MKEWEMDTLSSKRNLHGRSEARRIVYRALAVVCAITLALGLTGASSAQTNSRDAQQDPIPSGRFTIFPETDSIDGWDWPDGVSVAITIADKPECDATGNPSGGFFSVALPDPDCDVVAGDIVTVSFDSTGATYVVEPISLTKVDPVANTISGTAVPDEMVFVWPHGQDGVIQTPTAGPDEAWLADFTDTGFSIAGASGRAEVRDGIGNATAVDWIAPALANPHFNVFPEWDALELWEWPDGTPVDVTIDDPGTPETPDFSGTYLIDADEGDPSFHAWINVGETYDVQPGDMITLTGETGSRAHTVRRLAITSVDVDTDIVYGTSDKGETVYVWPDDAGEQVVMVEGSPRKWQAVFSQMYDIQFESSGQAEIRDGDGNATAVKWMALLPARSPHFNVFPEWDALELWEWPDGTVVHVTIDDPDTRAPHDFKGSFKIHADEGDPSFHAWINVGEAYDVQPGDVITLTGKTGSRTHTVRYLAITYADAESNVVHGTSSGGETVYVWPHDAGDQVVTIGEAPAEWQADFASTDYIIELGSSGQAEIRDDDGNATSVEWTASNPRIAVYLEGEFVIGWNWPHGAEVHLTIDDPATTDKELDYEAYAPVVPTPFDPNTWWARFDLAEYDVKPGDVVLLTCWAITREHAVLPLTVDEIDGAADTVAGTSDQRAWVLVHPWDALFDTATQADEDGNWVIDFMSLYDYDLEPGTWGVAETFDVAGNSTAIDWQVPPLE